jgi:phosphatidylglycerophosphatase A
MIPRLSARFAFGHPAHIVALGFGSGLAPVAPGTVGTLLAFPIYMLLDALLDPLALYDYRAKPAALFGVIAVLFAIGVWACARTGRDLGIADHSAMNWDEVVAMLLVLLVAPAGWAWWTFAFFAFRFFDVIKPPPIGDVDRGLKGGLGVMLDDIIAAFYTLLVIAVVKRVFF